MLWKRKLDGKKKLSQTKINSSNEIEDPETKKRNSISDLSEPSKDLSDLCGDEKDDEKEQQRISFQNQSPEHPKIIGSIVRQFYWQHYR